ncbi:hypothetical protein [Anaerocolumna aminovalerica]|uniref:hypothetical protein n=1 Tax=Anaerocolumna aminovalerica TaxID=1527 RepID=UPI000BE2710F|nr:hypothetical protein [Anaerocolumna aminovalerica]
MENMNLQEAFIERLNTFLPNVDFDKLDKSCNSVEDGYAKEILKLMHDIFVEVYGTDYLDSIYEFVELPAVIQGRNTGHIGLGIVTLDLESSGEHWGTFFLTPRGVIDQGMENMPAADSRYLSQTYMPYDYWYTISLERDHHVDFDNVPEKIADMLNGCYPDQPEMKME